MSQLRLFFIFSLVFCLSSQLQAQSAKLFILATELRSANGKIIVKLFSDNESFVKEKPLREISFEKKGLVNGVIALNFDLEPGTYGITLLDDENGNGKMDNNLVKIPKEGFGFSNFYLTKLQRPHFDEFKVVIKPGKNKVDIRTKYL